MATVDRIESLRVKHLALKHAIEEENQRPHPDDAKLMELKKEKLRIKDEMTNLDHLEHAHH